MSYSRWRRWKKDKRGRRLCPLCGAATIARVGGGYAITEAGAAHWLALVAAQRQTAHLKSPRAAAAAARKPNGQTLLRVLAEFANGSWALASGSGYDAAYQAALTRAVLGRLLLKQRANKRRAMYQITASGRERLAQLTRKFGGEL